MWVGDQDQIELCEKLKTVLFFGQLEKKFTITSFLIVSYRSLFNFTHINYTMYYTNYFCTKLFTEVVKSQSLFPTPRL